MADTPRTQLERAYRLIQQERLDEASALLQPLVKKEPDNADAWWLLANAVRAGEARNPAPAIRPIPVIRTTVTQAICEGYHEPAFIVSME